MSRINDYRVFYGNAAANYLESLEKQHSSEFHEDPQDISKIVNDLEVREVKLK